MAAASAWLCNTASAADVRVVGLFPGKALVQIDGSAPRTLGIGQKAADGISLVAVDRDSATFDINGRRQVLRLGQGNSTAGAGGAGASVTLAADSRGHFITDGQINGGVVRFIVDTGATLVSLSAVDARRLGIDYSRGDAVAMNTANGIAKAWRVKLDTIRIGAISVNNVDAVVLENQNMPTLLGMSFLNRMEMRRDGQAMTLTKRY